MRRVHERSPWLEFRRFLGGPLTVPLDSGFLVFRSLEQNSDKSDCPRTSVLFWHARLQVLSCSPNSKLKSTCKEYTRISQTCWTGIQEQV
jgi:hypothetical protein